MTKEFWKWFVISDEGLLLRILLGCAILIAFALWEIDRKGLRQSRRWREYLFLLSVVVLTIAYAIVNDQVTCSISWEYFYYHDESMAQALGPLNFGQSPAMDALRLQAIRMAAKGAWTAGLLIGVAILMANNPSKRRPLPQVSYRRLYRLLVVPLVAGLVLSVMLGIAGYLGALSFLSPEMVSLNVLRPPRFMCVQGAHIGLYAGGMIGTVIAVIAIRKQRKNLGAVPVTAAPDATDA